MGIPVSLRDETRIGLPPLKLWPVLSNTERFNRSIGWPEVTLDPRLSPGDFAMQVRASIAGYPLEWRELPFEWVEGRFFRLTRLFRGGPLERFEALVGLEPAEGEGSKLSIDAEFHARGPVSAWILENLVGRRALKDLQDLAKRVEEAAKGESAEVYKASRLATPTDADALRDGLSRLADAPVHSGARERLATLLAGGFDDELLGLRPFELADSWRVDRIEVLKTFLHAVKAGLLDLSWRILCPNCSAAKQTASSLSGIKPSTHCDSCRIDYSSNLDENVELRFSVSPAVRPVRESTFCAGSPAHTPFAVAQLRLDPGKDRSQEVELGSEVYVLRGLSSKTSVWLRPGDDGAGRIRVDWGARSQRFKPGPVQLDFPAPGGAPELVRLERLSWRERAAVASVVTTLQEFRDLFSAEVLSPGVEIAVKNLAVLFSDLKGSTALYESVGDAAAYSLVRDHFDFLFRVIARHGGGVVKTIGDAVMAAFPTGSQALEAALAMQEEVGRLNEKLAPKPPVILKLGVHMGPCIAINSGGALDYFGTTINVAARVQNESKGGDVVITDAIAGDRRSSYLLSKRAWRSEPFELELKGLSHPFHLLRLSPR